MLSLEEKTTALKGYMDADGKFERFPGKRQKKKQAWMLEILSSKFNFGQTYSEQEVNEILNAYHSFNDPASLRRFMFGCGLFDRTIDGNAYRLLNKTSNFSF